MSEDIKFKKNRKPMPNILKLTLILCAVGIVCGTVVAVVDAITAPIIEETEKKILTKSLESVGVLNYSIIEENENISYIDYIDEIYVGNNEKNESVYAFKVVMKSKYVSKFTSLIVINKETKKVENIKLLSNATNNGLDHKFESDFNVIGSTNDDIDSNFKWVASATKSSASVKESIEIAFEQFNLIIGEQDNE